MTNDERFNKLEDEIKKLKEFNNHNNGVHRKIVDNLKEQIKLIDRRVDTIKVSSTPDAFNDIFGGFTGVKK